MHFCSNTPIVLLGCKKDLRNDMRVIAELRKTSQRPITPLEVDHFITWRISFYTCLTVTIRIFFLFPAESGAGGCHQDRGHAVPWMLRENRRGNTRVSQCHWKNRALVPFRQEIQETVGMHNFIILLTEVIGTVWCNGLAIELYSTGAMGSGGYTPYPYPSLPPLTSCHLHTNAVRLLQKKVQNEYYTPISWRNCTISSAIKVFLYVLTNPMKISWIETEGIEWPTFAKFLEPYSHTYRMIWALIGWWSTLDRMNYDSIGHL